MSVQERTKEKSVFALTGTILVTKIFGRLRFCPRKLSKTLKNFSKFLNKIKVNNNKFNNNKFKKINNKYKKNIGSWAVVFNFKT